MQRQPHTPMILRIGCLSCLAVMFAFAMLCSGIEGLALLAMSPVEFLFATLLATLTAVPYTAALLWLDRNEKEPVWLLATAFVWGAVVATAYSGIANTVFQGLATSVTGEDMLAGYLTASISAPLVEEFTKGIALVAIFIVFGHEFDNALDGVVYGAMVGMGFAWFENITYYMMHTDGAADMLKLAYLRGVLNGVSTHATFTGLTGLGFGLTRMIRTGWLRWGLIPLFWGLAMSAHFAWNAFAGFFAIPASNDAEMYLISFPVAVLVLAVPFMLLLAVVVALSWRHEHGIILSFLDDEASDVCPRADLTRLVPARNRSLYQLECLFKQGPSAWWRRRQLNRLLIDLAFIKWHHHRDEVEWSADEDRDVADLRTRIRLTRA